MSVLVIRGDARTLPLPDACVDLIVTSPPYFGLRSYTDGGEHYGGQIGSEATPGEYIAALTECTAEWVRVLKPCGSLFVNLGDKYAAGHGGSSTEGNGVNLTVQRNRPAAEHWAGADSHPSASRAVIIPGTRPKSLLGLPWRYALAVIDQLGLILRAEIIWAKPNGLPESVTDRVRRAHEQVFHFVLRPRYYSAVDEIREPQASLGRGRPWSGDVNGTVPTWGIGGTQSLRGARTTDQMNALNPLGKLPGSVWSIPSQPLTVPPALGIDHFAAFPMELPRRIIAGWSPPGVCTACGEGRRPVTQLDGAYADYRNRTGDWNASTWIPGVGYDQKANRRVDGKPVSWRGSITGYACACPRPDAPTRPAIILDPFGGTGTTVLLAHALGRHGITTDRSADYSRLAAWRTTDRGELARALEVQKPPAETSGQDALFEVAP